MRKFVAATVSAALCLASVAPAAAQNYRAEGFAGPRGVNATLNMRIPLGKSAAARAKPSYGLTFGMGKTVGAGLDGREMTRQLTLGDIRFNDRGKLSKAQLASFDLANLDQDRRMNLTGGDNTLWIVVGLVAAGVAVCLLADCFEGDDDDSSN
ncbi:MAG TPA: hypothetical protein VEW26_04605 [Allosphingosinicella sp.]|nr:hypothetical protein [Allosphingosinicella sp.]